MALLAILPLNDQHFAGYGTRKSVSEISTLPRTDRGRILELGLTQWILGVDGPTGADGKHSQERQKISLHLRPP